MRIGKFIFFFLQSMIWIGARQNMAQRKSNVFKLFHTYQQVHIFFGNRLSRLQQGTTWHNEQAMFLNPLNILRVQHGPSGGHVYTWWVLILHCQGHLRPKVVA